MTERDFRAELDALDDSPDVSDAAPASEQSAPALDEGARRLIDNAVGRKVAEDAVEVETAKRESIGTAALDWAKNTALPAIGSAAESAVDPQWWKELPKGYIPGGISLGG